MGIDKEKVDEAVLALLYLTLHDGNRAWKSFDWDALNRLHDKQLIENPVGHAKSISFTEEGLKESDRLFHKFFAKTWRTLITLLNQPVNRTPPELG